VVSEESAVASLSSFDRNFRDRTLARIAGFPAFYGARL